MQTPKRHFLEWNDAVWALSGPYLTHGATCGLGKVNKKKTVANWLFAQTPTSPYQSQSLHARWPPGCSSIHQVLLKLVQQFCCYGWSKIALSHYFGHLAYTQQLVLPPYKPWWHMLCTSATNRCYFTKQRLQNCLYHHHHHKRTD